MEKKKKWKILHSRTGTAEKGSQEQILSILLTNRGIITDDDKVNYLHPKLEQITPEKVGLDQRQLEKAVERIRKAIRQEEQIVVFGDYDVDGITGTAILWEALHSIGAKVLPYIPSRVEEGYGLSIQGIENLKRQITDTKVIITVDNGIVANEAVDFANENGLEVIITDHHTIGKKRPKAYAVVHTTKICGAGVAYVIVNQLIEKTRTNTTDPYLDLVALATVADLVPLQNANRILTKFGLDALHVTKRVGLVALFNESQIEQEEINTYAVGHIIGPRLNAMGRMGNAMDSLRLLCTKDANRAKFLAEKLGKTNRERQILTFELTEHANTTVMQQEAMKKLLFIHDERYEQGVIGLVAGKLVEKFYRPSIVLSQGEKYSKASARSIAGFNIIDFIRSASDLLVNAGGHPMAAGFTVETEKLPQLKETLESLAEQQILDEMLFRTLKIDCAILFSEINQSFYEKIQQLAPFGMANPEPVFVTKNVIVQGLRAIGAEGKHLKLRVLQDTSQTFDAIAFGMGSLYSQIHQNDMIDIVYTVDENEWNGDKKLQLKVKDISVG